MDSYMVRIYRKEENNPQKLVGVVQKVGVEEKEVFSTFDELWSILNPVRKDTRQKGRKTKRQDQARTEMGWDSNIEK